MPLNGMNIRMFHWAIAALYLLFLFPTPEYPPYNADDGSWFVTMGWNLAHYGRYTSDTFPLEDYGYHAAWPPLFAGLLAGVIKIAGLNWMVLKLVMALFGLSALALLGRLWRDERIGSLAVLLTALSPAFFLYSHHTMTEVPYIATVTVALLGLSHAENGRAAFLAGLLAVLAFFTRGYAVIFLPAGLLYFLLRPWPLRQRLGACLAYALPLVVAILAWKGYTGHVLASQPLDWITTRFGDGTGILNDLLRSPREYAQRLYWHDLRYPAHFLLPLMSLEWARQHDISVVLSLLLLAIIGYGWLQLFRRRRGALECWLPLALAFMMVPRTGAARYWLPFLPFLFYYLLHGLNEIGQRLPRMEVLTRALRYTLVVLLAAALAWHLAAPDRLRFITPGSKDFRDIALWAGANLPREAVVVAPIASRFMATSGLRTWPGDQLADALPTPLRGAPALYLLCSPDSGKALAELCTRPYQRVMQRGDYSLYRVEPISSISAATP